MKKNIKLIKSPIGTIEKHKKTVKALGLYKLNQSVSKEITPQINGMIKSISYLLEITD